MGHRVRTLLVLAGVLTAQACIKAPPIAVVDNRTSLEIQAAGEYPELEFQGVDAALEPGPSPVSGKEIISKAGLAAAGQDLDLFSVSQTQAQFIDTMLLLGCLGEADEGLLEYLPDSMRRRRRRERAPPRFESREPASTADLGIPRFHQARWLDHGGPRRMALGPPRASAMRHVDRAIWQMGAEGVLSRVWRWIAVGAVLMQLAAPAHAKPRDRKAVAPARRGTTQGLIRPRRVTIGDSNHFMGVLGPGARYLYYVTDEYNSYDLFIQSPVSSSGEPLFEAFGDIVWPAISPDGRELAYIRYEREARGDACIRRIRDNGKVRSDRQDCHETDDADLQIYWRQDGHLGILLREELHGDHVLLDDAFGRHPTRKDANVVGFALSPDDRWVAYVPLARTREDVGVSFSNRISTEGIRIRRAVPGAEELAYRPDLPGVSAYPSFSPDGTYLYFSQFLNDTNKDGTIDGDDNGVVFRVAFPSEAEQAELGRPEQLTSAHWNCHYPSVREEVMALTCGIEGNLHIYLLPPSGAVPAGWDQARIAAQAERVQNPWNELLLRQHLLVGATHDEERSEQLKWLTRLHLGLREYEAAMYYAERRKQLLEADGVVDRWSELMILYARHRRADRGLSRGVLSEEYVLESIAVGSAAESIDASESPNIAALRSLVLGRISE